MSATGKESESSSACATLAMPGFQIQDKSSLKNAANIESWKVLILRILDSWGIYEVSNNGLCLIFNNVKGQLYICDRVD